MKLKNILIIISLSSMVLLILLLIYLPYIFGDTSELNKSEAEKIYVAIFKVVIVSFFVCILIAIIPDILKERKYKFKMCKEAKKLYSEVETGIDYLNYGLPYFASANEALKHIEELHRKKHLAETYYEFLPSKNKDKSIPIEKRIWISEAALLKVLEGARNKILKVLDNWNNISEKKKMDLFDSIHKSLR